MDVTDDNMYAEWRAWQAVVAESRQLGIEPNEAQNDRLYRLIEWWGEELVTLRVEQSDGIRQDARMEKRARALAALSR